jgi:hypothetical protein
MFHIINIIAAHREISTAAFWCTYTYQSRPRFLSRCKMYVVNNRIGIGHVASAKSTI